MGELYKSSQVILRDHGEGGGKERWQGGVSVLRGRQRTSGVSGSRIKTLEEGGDGKRRVPYNRVYSI